ncbi:lipid A oxidase (Involved in formation of 2-aminogluconate) protein [Primorskyibacter flagellatus]|uniref:Lipid A oxidase (Involved in formation of 2-aminogluconate) protein n=1 Tax=Primorskyibacter flagellatus TaxID=1387277 RepID=A0A917EHR6_9RHOB|nr:outer membrane beta-barrel protein [Primorskyibacter flagellatus]GGE36599.1 lipid A oxidase (Involved in formation of 2-aminogluconate) protein [Primorskyibacter flagellatus]
MLKAFPKTIAALSLGLTALSAAPAAAEIELSFYTGYQTAPHSRVKGNRGASSGGTAFDNLIGWQGKSFEAPPYYGLRGTWWQQNNIGYGLEFSHNKVYAPNAEMPAGFTRLEFTDGLNILTANVAKRWPGLWGGAVTPYVIGGVGIAVPHVDVTEGTNRTFGYQYTGPAARVTAGAKYEINEKWSVFGEYQFTASQNKADLTGGGSMETRIFTNALNVGVGFSF